VAKAEPGSARGALAIRPFRRVWTGATISAAGDAGSWVALVALALRAVHADLPLLVVLYTAPVAAGGWLAGWALDRFERRTVMIVDSLLRAVVFASVPLALAFGVLGAPQLYAVAAVYGLCKMVTLAGFPSLIPALVPDDHLDQANALEGLSYGLASLVGATLAGVAVATVGAAWVVSFDALSYVVMAVSLASVPSAPLCSTSPRPTKKTSVAAIVGLALRDPVLRDTTIMFALFNVGDGALLVFLPHRAIGLGLGSGGYGFLVAATTGGELIAATFLARRSWKRPLGASIAVAQAMTAGFVVLLLVPNAVVTVVALLLVGVCSAPMTAWAQSLRMRRVDPEHHGRLFAVLRTTMQATPPLGAVLASQTITAGISLTVVAVSACMAVPVVALGTQLARHAARGQGRDGAVSGSPS
jgi:MFS family permease